MKKYLEYFYLYGESYETVSKLLILWLTILGKYFNFSYTRVLEHVHHTENSEYVLIKFERPRQILDKTMPTGKKGILLFSFDQLCHRFRLWHRRPKPRNIEDPLVRQTTNSHTLESPPDFVFLFFFSFFFFFPLSKLNNRFLW